MANVDFFGDGGDYQFDPGVGGAFTTQPVPGESTPGDPYAAPIGTGPITTQPLPRATGDPSVPGAGAFGGGLTPTTPYTNNATPRTYTGADGFTYRDDPNPNSVSGFVRVPSMSAQDFIRQYQGQNARPDLNGLLNAMRAAGYNVSPYMYGNVASHNELMLDGQKYKVISGEDSPNPQWYAAGTNDGGGGGTGGVNPNGMGYTDPSANIYLSQLASRLNQLNTPQHDPFEDILKLFALARVGDLSGAPYTGAEDAAMVAHYRDPLTEARDASLQRNRERIGARGMAPTSGLLDVLNRGTEQTYERGIASGSNDLAVRAVAEKNRRADEQLAILNSILGVNRTGVDRTNALRDEAVKIASAFPEFDAQRLEMLLKASGEGASNPASVMSNLNQLGNLGLGSSIYQNNQDQANAAFWGQLIARAIGG